MDNRKISIAIPTYNREDVLFESFANIIDDSRVENIHISDDASELGIFQLMVNKINQLENKSKISITRNFTNQDCFINKQNAIIGQINKINDWCILADSDNVFGIDYLNRLFEIGVWESDTIYTPCFAYPNFDFRAYSGLLITKENVAEYIDKPMFETMLNACNYFVNRNEYLRVWDGSVDPVTSDSIYVCLRWLEAGNKIQVVDGLQYYHRVWPESHYQKNVNRTPIGFHQEVLNKLRQLK